MDFTSIINLLDMDRDDLYTEVERNMIDQEQDYEESDRIFYEQIEKLDDDACDLIETNVNNMISISNRAYFSEGFKHGIKFIIEQLTGHEIDIDVLNKFLLKKYNQEDDITDKVITKEKSA
ncbi:MAG TPA: hypothetical protein VF941_05075 [Clostridia bacterium]